MRTSCPPRLTARETVATVRGGIRVGSWIDSDRSGGLREIGQWVVAEEVGRGDEVAEGGAVSV